MVIKCTNKLFVHIILLRQLVFLYSGSAVVVERAGGGGGSPRASRALGVRRPAPRPGAPPQKDAACAAETVATVPLFAG